VASDPAQASDGRTTTAWTATVPGEGPLQVGLVVDLESTKAIRGIELATDTPGFSVEIYGTESPELPPDVTDPRWAHPADRAKVDAADRDGDKAGDGRERIELGRTRRSATSWCGSPFRRPRAAPCGCRKSRSSA
jgi:hypothetical protein